MLQPKQLQVYAAGSKIFGEYGNPVGREAGAQLLPGADADRAPEPEWIRVEGSPVGALSLPLAVGATGSIYHANLEVNF